MPIDMKKFNKRRGEVRSRLRRAAYYAIPDGETLFYLCPPLPSMDDYAALEYTTHFSIGPQRVPGVCLSADNASIWHPETQKHLSQRQIKIDPGAGCPVCDALVSGEPVSGMDEDALGEMEPQERYLFRLIPWARIVGDEQILFAEHERVPVITRQGPRIWLGGGGPRGGSGVEDLIGRYGDITDPDNAILFVISRVGTGRFGTRYDVYVDPRTIREPLKLPKPQQHALRKAMESGGDLDPFRKLAWMIRPADELDQLLRTGAVDSQDASDNIQAGRPSCYGIAQEYDPSDEYCNTKCKDFEECGEVVGVTAEKPEPEPEPPKRKRGRPRKTKPAPEPEPPEEEPEEEPEAEAQADESEEEPEPPPRRRRASARRPSRGRVRRAAKEPEEDEDDIPDHQPPDNDLEDSDAPDDLAKIQAKLQRKRRAKA